MFSDLCQAQLYKRKSKNLEKLGFDWSKDPMEEYVKIQSLLYSEYHILCESMLTIMRKYDIPSSKTMHTFFRIFDIESRSFSDAMKNAIHEDRINPPGSTSYRSGKSGWHRTWEGKNVFLRSNYELDYALKLDGDKIKYDCECLRIKYFDSQEQKYRIAIPDFYLSDTNTIVEIKSAYWLDKINMDDKIKSYKDLGFNFKLILDKKEL